ncbi:MAG: methylamine utilization protein [Proteobacteria bacterium]|nr:methylamine utilization protein [Pseudomonadota bacterium]
MRGDKPIFVVAFAVAAVASWTALAAVDVLITQHDRKFSQASIAIKRGVRVGFTNDDPFIHHIFVSAPTMRFDSGEHAPSRTIEVPFDRIGSFEVRCAIHPKMLLEVTVTP